MWVWLDIETTGLKPDQHEVLEVAVVVTTPRLIELARGDWVMRMKPSHLSLADERAVQMHSSNGLIYEALYRGEPVEDVRSGLHSVLSDAENTARKVDSTLLNDPPVLAGASVHFDRSFMKQDFDTFMARLSHRHVDISTLKIVLRAMGHDIPRRQTSHRAMEDVEAEIEEMRNIMQILAPYGIDRERRG